MTEMVDTQCKHCEEPLRIPEEKLEEIHWKAKGPLCGRCQELPHT